MIGIHKIPKICLIGKILKYIKYKILSNKTTVCSRGAKVEQYVFVHTIEIYLSNTTIKTL